MQSRFGGASSGCLELANHDCASGDVDDPKTLLGYRAEPQSSISLLDASTPEYIYFI